MAIMLESKNGFITFTVQWPANVFTVNLFMVFKVLLYFWVGLNFWLIQQPLINEVLHRLFTSTIFTILTYPHFMKLLNSQLYLFIENLSSVFFKFSITITEPANSVIMYLTYFIYTHVLRRPFLLQFQTILALSVISNL